VRERNADPSVCILRATWNLSRLMPEILLACSDVVRSTAPGGSAANACGSCAAAAVLGSGGLPDFAVPLVFAITAVILFLLAKIVPLFRHQSQG
jgi:hypothetical protein